MSKAIPLVERLAEYAVGLRYEQIPQDATHIAKQIVFDTLGTGLGGLQRPLGARAAQFAALAMPGSEATILGDGRRASTEGAAFANATMIKILGMDDSHRTGSHIAAEVVPAALALSETRLTTGRELIEALVAAYDLAIRLGTACRTEQRARGLDLKGTVGALSATLAAGRCAGLDAHTLSHALALAADMSSGTEQYVYDGGLCDTKDLIAGFAARSGVFATRLAQAGFHGPRGALDGEYGFSRAFGPGEFAPDLFDDLGQNFVITGTAFKPHGGCRHTHQAVDAVQALRSEHSYNPNDIQRVVVQTYRAALEPSFRIDADPPSQAVAGLSIRVGTAIALVYGRLWPDDLHHWDDPVIRRLRHAIEVEIDPEVECEYPARNGSRVLVTLRDGRTLVGEVRNAKGEPEFPMTDEEFRAKFDVLTRPILPVAQADRLYDVCMHLENVSDVAVLLKLATITERASVLNEALLPV